MGSWKRSKITPWLEGCITMGSWIRTEVDSKQNAKALRRSGCGISIVYPARLWNCGSWLCNPNRWVNQGHRCDDIGVMASSSSIGLADEDEDAAFNRNVVLKTTEKHLVIFACSPQCTLKWWYHWIIKFKKISSANHFGVPSCRKSPHGVPNMWIVVVMMMMTMVSIIILMNTLHQVAKDCGRLMRANQCAGAAEDIFWFTRPKSLQQCLGTVPWILIWLGWVGLWMLEWFDLACTSFDLIWLFPCGFDTFVTHPRLPNARGIYNGDTTALQLIGFFLSH